MSAIPGSRYVRDGIAGQGAVVMVAGWREGPDWGGGYPTSFQDVACAIGVARKIGPVYGANPIG